MGILVIKWGRILVTLGTGRNDAYVMVAVLEREDMERKVESPDHRYCLRLEEIPNKLRPEPLRRSILVDYQNGMSLV